MKGNHLLHTIIVLLVATVKSALAQSPPSLISDMDLSATACGSNLCSDFPGVGAFFSSLAQVQNAFNEGRRQEEIQLGLPTNSLGSLVLPANYTSLSAPEKALVIINLERTARGGMTYTLPTTVGPVLGLPLEGIDVPLNTLAQNYADSLAKYDTSLDHNLYGTTPYTRIADMYGECEDFNSRLENLYYSCGGSTDFLIEQALFSWIYRDSSSSWEHRATVLIQDVDAITGSNGFDDNHGPAGVEGFLGIGVLAGISDYGTCDQGANIVVMDIMDPSDYPSCNFIPLPVDLLSFEVKKEGAALVKMEWKTTREYASEGFEVQRSTDMKNWMKIGFVGSSDGSEQRGQKLYTFWDENPEKGQQYYRLKQIDLSGNFELFYAKGIYIDFDESEAPVAFPNPVISYLKINNLSNGAPYELYDLQGRRLISTTYQEEEGISFEKLQEGSYLLRVWNRGRWYSRKIIK